LREVSFSSESRRKTFLGNQIPVLSKSLEPEGFYKTCDACINRVLVLFLYVKYPFGDLFESHFPKFSATISLISDSSISVDFNE